MGGRGAGEEEGERGRVAEGRGAGELRTLRQQCGTRQFQFYSIVGALLSICSLLLGEGGNHPNTRKVTPITRTFFL